MKNCFLNLRPWFHLMKVPKGIEGSLETSEKFCEKSGFYQEKQIREEKPLLS